MAEDSSQAAELRECLQEQELDLDAVVRPCSPISLNGSQMHQMRSRVVDLIAIQAFQEKGLLVETTELKKELANKESALAEALKLREEVTQKDQAVGEAMSEANLLRDELGRMKKQYDDLQATQNEWHQAGLVCYDAEIDDDADDSGMGADVSNWTYVREETNKLRIVIDKLRKRVSDLKSARDEATRVREDLTLSNTLLQAKYDDIREILEQSRSPVAEQTCAGSCLDKINDLERLGESSWLWEHRDLLPKGWEEEVERQRIRVDLIAEIKLAWNEGTEELQHQVVELEHLLENARCDLARAAEAREEHEIWGEENRLSLLEVERLWHEDREKLANYEDLFDQSHNSLIEIERSRDQDRQKLEECSRHLAESEQLREDACSKLTEVEHLYTENCDILPAGDRSWLAEVLTFYREGRPKLAEVERLREAERNELAEVEKLREADHLKLAKVERLCEADRAKLAEVERLREAERNKLAEVERLQKLDHNKLAEVLQLREEEFTRTAEMEGLREAEVNKLADRAQQWEDACRFERGRVAELERMRGDICGKGDNHDELINELKQFRSEQASSSQRNAQLLEQLSQKQASFCAQEIEFRERLRELEAERDTLQVCLRKVNDNATSAMQKVVERLSLECCASQLGVETADHAIGMEQFRQQVNKLEQIQSPAENASNVASAMQTMELCNQFHTYVSRTERLLDEKARENELLRDKKFTPGSDDSTLCLSDIEHQPCVSPEQPRDVKQMEIYGEIVRENSSLRRQAKRCADLSADNGILRTQIAQCVGMVHHKQELSAREADLKAQLRVMRVTTAKMQSTWWEIGESRRCAEQKLEETQRELHQTQQHLSDQEKAAATAVRKRDDFYRCAMHYKRAADGHVSDLATLRMQLAEQEQRAKALETQNKYMEKLVSTMSSLRNGRSERALGASNSGKQPTPCRNLDGQRVDPERILDNSPLFRDAERKNCATSTFKSTRTALQPHNCASPIQPTQTSPAQSSRSARGRNRAQSTPRPISSVHVAIQVGRRTASLSRRNEDECGGIRASWR